MVQRGETLYRIARNNGLTVEELQRMNDLPGTTIRPGQRLVVGYQAPAEEVESPPAEPPPEQAAPTPEPLPADAPTYTARPGDTFYSIALRYGTTADTLLALNDERTAPLEPGQPVRLPASFGPVTHTVQPGETLHGVARTYGLELDVLRSVNRGAGDSLQAGQTLRIPARRVPVAPRPGTLPPPDTAGVLARYPETFAGRLTASGTPYDPAQFTVSHPDLPLGTVVLLTNSATGRRTFAVVTDRGPIDASYLMDASDAVVEALGSAGADRPSVQVHVIQ